MASSILYRQDTTQPAPMKRLTKAVFVFRHKMDEPPKKLTTFFGRQGRGCKFGGIRVRGCRCVHVHTIQGHFFCGISPTPRHSSLACVSTPMARKKKLGSEHRSGVCVMIWQCRAATILHYLERCHTAYVFYRSPLFVQV